MNKAELRKKFLAQRTALSPDDSAQLSQKLSEQFKQVDLTAVNCIHIYLPIKARNEPDTFLIVNWLKSTHPEIIRVYPKADFLDYSMQSFIDDESLKLANNEFGIPEPTIGTKIDINKIDMVVVPLLAFDKKGYRVGYGKGFYDRFIAQCKPSTQFIGLSFFDPVDTIEDLNQYDLPLHQCITPDKIWKF